jgi:hypothetical protein
MDILTDALPDFDTLVRMAKEDPTVYEAFRQKILKDAVAQAPAQHRPMLEKTVEVIEDAHHRAENPLHATILASTLMQESLATLRSGMNHLQFAAKDFQDAAAEHLDDPLNRTYITTRKR